MTFHDSTSPEICGALQNGTPDLFMLCCHALMLCFFMCTSSPLWLSVGANPYGNPTQFAPNSMHFGEAVTTCHVMAALKNIGSLGEDWAMVNIMQANCCIRGQCSFPRKLHQTCCKCGWLNYLEHLLCLAGF